MSERERLGEHQSRGKPLQKAAIANDMPNDVIDENNVEEAAVWSARCKKNCKINYSYNIPYRISCQM